MLQWRRLQPLQRKSCDDVTFSSLLCSSGCVGRFHGRAGQSLFFRVGPPSLLSPCVCRRRHPEQRGEARLA